MPGKAEWLKEGKGVEDACEGRIIETTPGISIGQEGEGWIYAGKTKVTSAFSCNFLFLLC